MPALFGEAGHKSRDEGGLEVAPTLCATTRGPGERVLGSPRMADVEKGPKAYAEVVRTKAEIEESKRHLILAKFVYFFDVCCGSPWEPFAAYFLSTRNIKTGTIGVLLTVMTISNAIVGQMLPVAADHYHVHKWSRSHRSRCLSRSRAPCISTTRCGAPPCSASSRSARGARCCR